MIYELSKRQLSSVNESGRVLRVVIPAPPELPGDLRRWASERLPSVAGMISTAKTINVIVQPRQSENEQGLTGLLGSIRDTWDEDRFCMLVHVVEVTLSPQNVRGRNPRRQWPGGPIATVSTKSSLT
jgi:hypothetical protein